MNLCRRTLCALFVLFLVHSGSGAKIGKAEEEDGVEEIEENIEADLGDGHLKSPPV